MASQDRCAFYQYTPLDMTKQQIRLITLHRLPTTLVTLLDTDTIHCAIETFDVETVPAYIALSYTWGSPEDTRIVYIDNKPFRIRTNLFDFLGTFRSDDANTRYL
jgi:hypothetical protein